VSLLAILRSECVLESTSTPAYWLGEAAGRRIYVVLVHTFFDEENEIDIG